MTKTARMRKKERVQAAGDVDAMTKKIISDAVAYIRGLAEMRGRNADWAEKAVREGVSLTASDALEDERHRFHR
jgi:membrane-bound serine protease (ClpP class)